MGRHPGTAKTGGRQRGTRNRRTLETIEKAAAQGPLPLEHMLKVMNDPNADNERRDRMAVAAAPYVHPKLTSEDAGMNVNIHGEYTNGKGYDAETNGIVVQFVKPRHAVDE